MSEHLRKKFLTYLERIWERGGTTQHYTHAIQGIGTSKAGGAERKPPDEKSQGWHIQVFFGIIAL